MRDAAPQAIHLDDYSPPAFLISSVDARRGHPRGRGAACARRSRSRATPACASARAPLVLDGEDLELVCVAIDGRALGPGGVRASTPRTSPSPRCRTRSAWRPRSIRPGKNTKLEGLYHLGGLFTQCEAEGFRRITYFPDRPDVLARYTVRIAADQATYPRAARPTATWSHAGRARRRRPRTSRAGTTRSPSPATCSPWWPANSTCWRTASPPRSGRKGDLRIYVDPRQARPARASRWTR